MTARPPRDRKRSVPGRELVPSGEASDDDAGAAEDRRRSDRRRSPRTKRAAAAPLAAFEAQLIGQEGRRRGLKAGPPAVEEANAAYLETEWSGPADRRLRTGVIARAKV